VIELDAKPRLQCLPDQLELALVGEDGLRDEAAPLENEGLPPSRRLFAGCVRIRLLTGLAPLALDVIGVDELLTAR